MAATGSEWLPPVPPVRSLEDMRWWKPAGVAEQLVPDGRWDQLGYIVIDELHEEVAGLVVGRWPRVDGKGRLRFGEEEEFTRIATPAPALQALLQTRLPIVAIDIEAAAEDALRSRELAIGDVFAARNGRPPGEPGGGGPGGEPLEDPGAIFGDQVLDITAEARQAAKLQTTSATSGVMGEALLTAIADEIAEDDEPPEHEPDPGSTPPESSGGSPAAAPPPLEASELSATATHPSRHAEGTPERARSAAEIEAELDAATHAVDAEEVIGAAASAANEDLARMLRELLPRPDSSSEAREDRPGPEAVA